MCWNKEVSLNTFLFSGFILLLIIYNNKYTKYKINELNHFWMYMFLISFIIIQLIEHLIWKNFNNPFYNKLFTICAIFVILIMQPLTSLMNVNNFSLRNNLILSYLGFLSIYVINNYPNFDFYSIISKKGHLIWRFNENNNIIYNKIFPLIWLFFFLFSLFYNGHYSGFAIAIMTLLLAVYNYTTDKTITSMWCWLSNSIMMYYCFILIFYLPFIKK